jgi:uncharacterized protein YukE
MAEQKTAMRFTRVLLVGLSSVLIGCSRGPKQAADGTDMPKSQDTDVQELARTIGNIGAYVSDLEGRLRLGRAQTWNQDASAAQHTLGNLRLEINTLKRRSQNVGNIEAYLGDLEGRLRGARGETWNQDASAAQHILGNLRIEIAGLQRGLQRVSRSEGRNRQESGPPNPPPRRR